MNIWLLDTETFVKVNGLQPITNPVMFDRGNAPTSDGLFSTDIFGVTSKDRRETWAYIDLNMHFIAPKVYLSLKRLNRNFESVVYSSKKFSIKDGILVPDENGGTGLKWLYDNWEKIKFSKNDSTSRNQRVNVIQNNKKDVVFMTKQVVLPAFYRDVDTTSRDGNPKVPEINDAYAKIIRTANMIKDSNDMDFMVASMVGQVQDLIVDIYNLLKSKLEKKNGYIRKFLMGKSIDYGSRVVITAVPFTANKPEDQTVNFYTTGIPLSHICSEFAPFMKYYVQRWFKQHIENHKNNFAIVNDSGEFVTVKLDNPEAYYNEDYIDAHLAQFTKNPYTRFDKIELPISAEELKRIGRTGPVYYALSGFALLGNDTMSKGENKFNRPMTWTDLFYIAAIDSTSDKHVVVTRYPYLDFNGSYISRIFVISTRETMPVSINGTVYKNYPVIDPNVRKEDLDSIFRDTVNVCPMYLPGLGGDHDGDQITVKGVFTQESNEECERIITSKLNLLSIEGKGIRTIGNEGAQALYSMTKFH